jgi:serine/threonine protein kinase
MQEEPPMRMPVWAITNFEVIEKLGHGFFGTVNLVKHQLDNKYYALKEIRKFDI